MSSAAADHWAWLLVLSFVFGCNVLRILLPSFSSFMSRVLQKDAEQESQMRAEIQDMKQELSTVNMMDEFARYARLERKINKMTDKLKTHVKARTAQLAKIKWVISVAFYVLQGEEEVHRRSLSPCCSRSFPWLACWRRRVFSAALGCPPTPDQGQQGRRCSKHLDVDLTMMSFLMESRHERRSGLFISCLGPCQWRSTETCYNQHS
ncbi:guided entry of tail-anchored proteins factor 1 isoform X2 [Macaca fascicularis]|uniref:guided entry of tail-anchored proteins factor 1 isoform X2 n=1 Tax=Macaca fascicularis TaxID=9541 RepID=UPI003D153DD7